MSEQLRRILCVDDDADIRLLLDYSLTQIGGYEVRCCADGPSALALAPQFHPDLVLLDVMMPGMRGPETLVALRALPEMQGVPVIFVTAKALPSDLEPLLQLGATGVIVKPFNPMTLPDDIRPFWEYGRGQRNA
jgi:CheY-like chemotaxis protein